MPPKAKSRYTTNGASPDFKQFGFEDTDEGKEMYDEAGIVPPPDHFTESAFSTDQVVAAAMDWFQLQRGFPYKSLPLHVCMQQVNQLASMDPDSMRGTSLAYNVADHYHPHRMHAHATGKVAPTDAYRDAHKLEHGIRQELEGKGSVGGDYFSMLSLTLGTQACSNFRPGFACYYYRKYCPEGGTVLDTSTGYGGRLVGALASRKVKRYVGIDPNRPTHIGNQRLAYDLAEPLGVRVDLLNLPAEDVFQDGTWGGQYYDWQGKCDLAFTSPPYFRKELYSEADTQSWVRYGEDKSGEQWRLGFLLPMLRLQYAALKPECFAVVNIADVTIGTRRYPLKDWAIEGAKEVGFQYVGSDSFRMGQRLGANQEDGVAEEPVLQFRKPA